MSDFKELVKNLYTSKDRELTPEKFDYIQKTYAGGKEQEFVKNFYETIGEDLTQDKLTYITDTYLKKKEPLSSESLVTKYPSPLQETAKLVTGEIFGDISKGIAAQEQLKPKPKTKKAEALHYGQFIDIGQPIAQEVDKSKAVVPESGPMSWEMRPITTGQIQGKIANILPAGKIPTADELGEIAELNKELQSIPRSEAQIAFEKDGFGIFKKSPLLGVQFLGETMLSSLSALVESGKRTVPTAVGMGAAMGAPIAGVGAPIGAATGFTAGLLTGGYNISTSQDILNSLSDNGVDISDKDSLINAFSDEKRMAKIRSTAAKYGVPILAFDALTSGIAGKLIGGAVGKSLSKKIIAGMGEAGIQAVGGSGGELAGQLASGKKVNWDEVALEGIASLATDVPDITVGAMIERRNASSNNKTLATQIAIQGNEAGLEDAKINLDRDLKNGVISEQEYQDGLAFAQKAAEINTKIPEPVQGENRATSIELIAERDKIRQDNELFEAQKQTVDEAYHSDIDQQIKNGENRIKEINNQIIELSKPKEEVIQQPIEDKKDVLNIENKKKDILDEVTDEKIGEKDYQNFSINFSDGARAFGTIEDGVAFISGINAPKSEKGVIRGSKTYERLLGKLKEHGISTVQIKLQSKDSSIAIDKLLKNGILTNPRSMTGVSVDQRPTKFDISEQPIQQIPDENIQPPTEEQILDDLKNKRFVTFEYKSELEVPDVFKNKITSIGEINGVKSVKVTLTKSEADYELNKNKTQEYAVQVESPTSVLQPTQERIGETGSERGGMEQGKQGEEVTPKSISEAEAKVNEEVGVEPIIELNKDNKQPFTTKSKKQIVSFENGDLIVRDAKTGVEVSAQTKKKALREYAENFDFTVGEKSAEPSPDMQFKDENELNQYVIENSQNPTEIAEVYINQEPTTQPLSTVERMIADYGVGKVTNKSFERFGDRNLKGISMAKAYFNNQTGQSIDQVAKEMSDHYDVEITPQDIADFMVRFPNGEGTALKLVESEVASNAAAKFKELTGLNLNQEIAQKVIEQQFNKLSKAEQLIAQQDYESATQLEEAYWREYEKTNGFTEESPRAEIEPKEAGKRKEEPKIEAKEGAKEPPTTPPTPPKEPEKGVSDLGKKMRAFYKNIIERAKGLSEEDRNLLKDNPNALYDVLPHSESRKIAEELIEELGVDEAVLEATKKTSNLQPVERVMILGAAMDYYAKVSKEKLKSGDEAAMQKAAENEIDAQEKMQNIAKELGTLGTDFGRAISIFNEVYKLSNLALERKLKLKVDQVNKSKQELADQQSKEIKKIVTEDKDVAIEAANDLTEAELMRNADAIRKISDLEKEVADLKKQILERDKAQVGTKKNPLKIKRITNDTEYDKRVKEFQQRQRSIISKDDISDLTYFGLYHIENGITKFADWYEVMNKKFKGFKDKLPSIYTSVREKAIENGADKDIFDNNDTVSNFFNSDKIAKEYRILETERNRQLAKVEKLKEKLTSLEKEGLPVKEKKYTEKDTPEIEELKQKVKDLEKNLRKKEIDAKNTEYNLSKLQKELTRVRERRAKEKSEKRPASKELSDAEKDIIDQIKSENDKWVKEKQFALQAKKDYAAMESERNRQIEKEEKLREKLDILKSGKRPETKTTKPKIDTPTIEKLKSDIKIESEKLSAIEKQQKRIEDLETELQRLKDRKPKEENEKIIREVSDREKELKNEIYEEKKKINEEWKSSPEYQAESDAKKMALLTKKVALATLKEAMENNPDRARVQAPKIAAERIRKDAERNLDMSSTKTEQTYLKKLVQTINTKAKEYYKETKQNVKNINDILAFAIANSKSDYKIWERTKEEVERQIDQDTSLTDEQKSDVKEFLEDYTESIFDTLLTTNQIDQLIREKLIENGYGTEKMIKGKLVKAVDWNKVTSNEKNRQEAKSKIIKAINDLGFNDKNAKAEIDAILTQFDNKILDKKTAGINALLNKGVLNKVKSALGVKKVSKSQVGKLIEMNNKGILDDVRVKDVLADELGLVSLSKDDLARVRELSSLIDNPNIPEFMRKQFQEQLQYLFDSKGGNLMYLENREFTNANRLSSLYNQIQNMTGLTRPISTLFTVGIKTGNFGKALKVYLNETFNSIQDAKTILIKGRVSRGTSFSDLTMTTEGEVRTRYLEYSKGKIFGGAGLGKSLYAKLGGKTVDVNLLNQAYSKTKFINRLLESVDTIGSGQTSGLTRFWQITKYINKFYPELSSKQKSQKIWDMLYSIDRAAERPNAIKSLEEAGIKNPSESEINRTINEKAERNINKLISQDFYRQVESLKPMAETALRNEGNENPTADEITSKVYKLLGTDEPLDVVARGERQAARETGKLTTVGITSLLITPLDLIQKGISQKLRKNTTTSGRLFANGSDAAISYLFPYVHSIGRWLEMQLELTPYGYIKSAVYKSGLAKAIEGADKAKFTKEEYSELGDDYAIRATLGISYEIIGMYAISLANMLAGEEEDKDKEKVIGTAKKEKFPQERVQSVGKPKQSINIAGYNIPLQIFGNSGISMGMYADAMKYMKDPEYQERSILYISAMVLMENASSQWFESTKRYGGIASALTKGQEEKYAPALGKIFGSIAGSQIPYNRFQTEMATVLNPQSKSSIDFGVNVLNQMSIFKSFTPQKPNFDYRGRTYDYGDIFVNSADGVVKMFKKSKGADEADEFLSKINFAATDAYRETKDIDNYNFAIIGNDGKKRSMTPDEYYVFKFNTAKLFNEYILKSYKYIDSKTILDNGIINKEETLKFKKQFASFLLTEAKKKGFARMLKEMKIEASMDIIQKLEENKLNLEIDMLDKNIDTKIFLMENVFNDNQ